MLGEREIWRGLWEAEEPIEISELEKVLGIKVDPRLDQVEQIKKIYMEKAPIAAKNEGDWSGEYISLNTIDGFV